MREGNRLHPVDHMKLGRAQEMPCRKLADDDYQWISAGDLNEASIIQRNCSMYDLFVITPRDTHFDSIAIMILS
jgi:hypothetical protein